MSDVLSELCDLFPGTSEADRELMLAALGVKGPRVEPAREEVRAGGRKTPLPAPRSALDIASEIEWV